MGIFRVDEKGLLVIDKDYIRGLEEYKVILERDKGSEGDAQARKKARAYKEFFYIMMLGDRTTYINQGGYNEKERHALATKEAQLEDTYKPDIAIKNAITKYIEIQDAESPTLNAVVTMLQGIKTANTICQGIIVNINRTLELQEKRRLENETNNTPTDYLQDLAMTEALVGQLDKFLKIAGKLPDTSDILESLRTKLEKEQKGNAEGRGGKKLGTRANPV